MIKKNRSIPKVLFLRNVFKTDCTNLNNTLESRIFDKHQEISNQLIVQQPKQFTYNTNLLESTTLSLNTDYQKNPRIFESLDTWPKGTNLHCWYCTNQFTGPPKPIAVAIEPNVHNKNNYKYSITVKANCCRWPCCMSYIQESTKDLTSFIEQKNNFYFLYYVWHGAYPTHIPYAPDKFLQKKFGGDLSTEEYYRLYSEIEERTLT